MCTNNFFWQCSNYLIVITIYPSKHIKVLSLKSRTVLTALFPFFQIICEVYFKNRHQLLYSFSLTSSNARKFYICENLKGAVSYILTKRKFTNLHVAVFYQTTPCLIHGVWTIYILQMAVDSWYRNSRALLILTLSIFEVVVLACVLPERGLLPIDSWSSLKCRYQNFIWTILIELFRKYNSLRM